MFAAVGAAVIFFLCRTLVLRRENSFQKSFYILPAAILLTIFINVFFVLSKARARAQRPRAPAAGSSSHPPRLLGPPPQLLYIATRRLALTHSLPPTPPTVPQPTMQGAGKLLLETAKEPGGDQSWCSNDGCSDIKDAAGVVTKKNGVNTNKAGWVSVAAAAGVAVIGSAILIPLLKRHAIRKYEGADKPAEVKVETDLEAGPETFMGRMKRIAMSGVNVDIHEVVQTDGDIFNMHEQAEQFDPKTEISFQYLQVFSAICVSFGHGANDVANACGPLAGIWATYEAGAFVKEADTPIWILVIGAVGLVVGLGTYGYNIMRALGVRMAAMTPSRGYAAELSTSLVVSIASAYGMPISTTHTITGAVVGVGLMEGRKGVNWKFLGKTFTSWIFTLIFVGILTAALFAQGAYAPSIMCNRQLQRLGARSG